MSDMERLGGNPPEGETPESDNRQKSSADVYLAPKLMSGFSAGLALIANVESIAGWDTASTDTIITAGIAAGAAACSAVAGFFLKDRN